MFDQPKAIRNAAKAIIVRDNNLLALAKQDSQGRYYLLPGGGQNHGETLKQALLRECLEEIGTEVEIGKLLFVREFIGNTYVHEVLDEDEKKWLKNYHSIDFIFACTVSENYIPKNGSSPDGGQQHVEWLSITKLNEYRIFPSPLKYLLVNPLNTDVYLGDVY
jgi:8-oxo-dGTP diphosphatase